MRWSGSAGAACWMRPRRSPGCCCRATACWTISRAWVAACRTVDRRSRSSPSRRPPAPAARQPRTPCCRSVVIDGYKKSFRDASWSPRSRSSTQACSPAAPRHLIAANGMDAFTQLLESYVSLRASPFTDALASSGMQAFRDGFWPAWTPGDPLAQQGYQKLAYASLCSGITLAQAGLGSVHGLASPLGAFFPIPHGVVCGTLVAAATRINIATLRDRDPNSPALRKYAEAGLLLGTRDVCQRGRGAGWPGRDAGRLDQTTVITAPWRVRHERRGHPPRRRQHCRGGSMQTNPLVLSGRRGRESAAAVGCERQRLRNRYRSPTPPPTRVPLLPADTDADPRRDPGTTAVAPRTGRSQSCSVSAA
jgi:hypothetical protein